VQLNEDHPHCIATTSPNALLTKIKRQSGPAAVALGECFVIWMTPDRLRKLLKQGLGVFQFYVKRPKGSRALAPRACRTLHSLVR
jgi:hypothetical protein